MLSKPFVNLFNWNPQLFREIKGRLKTRNVVIAISLSLLCQFIVMTYYLRRLPQEYGRYVTSDSQYCVEVGKYCTDIEWSSWWLDIFNNLSLILLPLMLIGGVYMLVGYLAKEQRLGTLNFIRLSPKSSQKILLGKLLGVPILIYLAVVIFLPLHLWANISSGLSLSWFFVFYGVLIIVCCFFYNTSLLFAFLVGCQAWLAAAITGIFFYLLIAAIDEGYSDEINALIGTHERNVLLIRIGVIITLRIGHMIISALILGSYWSWQAVNRRYRNPNATAINKKQSYCLMGCFQVYLMLCFLLHNIDYKSTDVLQESLALFCTLNLLWFLLVIAMLSPQRQSVEDWARYRHEQVNNDQTAIVKGLSISLKQDLIWSEKSPALVAIGINLVITAVIWIAWILFWQQNNTIKLSAILILILSFSLILIYAAVAQFILLTKVKKPTIWATGIVSGFIFLQPLALTLMSINPDIYPDLWLFSAFPSFALNNSLAITPILIAIIGQWTVLISVTLLLIRKIKKLGASDYQKLLIGQKD
ncbi:MULTISPECIES: hypothetical protein [unclassified Okeania]|uniref:hypothetical protein n=1 Tax=unclassified Okeania TaxID=2634635 RepID=UPI0013B9C230|nr:MULTISPECIES: hypothetical protein [unclassified Okeania]NES75122.1 hypothetical protein [Okeania sp. SIO1H4]NET13370.1 hypothetical protein [Okeania sp. SIO1H6]NET21149.1 hypothetical protein [Okeania sp. SIO1H5]NET93749.1 hypothetical protein [Okeania sp. SIO1H2]